MLNRIDENTKLLRVSARRTARYANTGAKKANFAVSMKSQYSAA